MSIFSGKSKAFLSTKRRGEKTKRATMKQFYRIYSQSIKQAIAQILKLLEQRNLISQYECMPKYYKLFHKLTRSICVCVLFIRLDIYQEQKNEYMYEF